MDEKTEEPEEPEEEVREIELELIRNPSAMERDTGAWLNALFGG
jgi:hypothetical protein